MGLMLLSSRDDSATIDDAVGIVPGYATNGVVYLVKSGGIPAANMGDTLYFKIYAKLTDGSYAYSAAGGYSAKAYAGSILSGNNSAEMKALVVAMLDYGAEAQLYFGHDTDALVNDALTAEQQALVKGYDSTMMDAVVKADSTKTGDFVRVNSDFKSLYPSVSFDGAFAINFYCTPAIPVDDDMTLYWWDMETMASVDELSVDNATGSMEMTDTNGTYWGQVAGIAAKEMDDTYYVSCVFESDGEKITTGIIPYSLGKYCSDKAAADGDPQQAFAQATAVYGYYAKTYFRGASEPSVSGTYIVGEDELPYSDEQIYQQLFDPNTKLEIDLDMSDKELQKLQDDYVRYRDMGSKSPIYRLGDMTITMTTAQGTVSYVIREVGARMKGNTSRNSFYNAEDGIYNYIHFKFDFQETFDDEDYYGADAKVWDSEEAREARKDRTFATLEKLEMRWNKLYDATYLKESYAYDVFRSEGVLAPQCNIGVLDWSGARMGIYTVEEPVDAVFIERNVSEEDAGGDLYKLGWTNEGATFTNTNSIGVEDEDKGQFYVYDLKTNKKKSTHEDLIRMIDTLNSGAVTKESFASVVDVDSFLRFAAVSYFMGGPDDLRNNYNNCYVYFLKSSGKAVFIPYDYDRCLGVNREYNPNGDSMTQDDPYGRGGQQSPLFRYSVDKGGFYTAEYTKVLLEVAENELLTADAFARRFAVAESLYAGQVGPERHLRNAEGRDFSFDLERTGSASGNSNMSFKDYMSAKMTAFRDYVGQSAVSGSKCYIRGDFNGWAIDSGYLMKKQGEVLVFTLDFDHRVSFKVYDDGAGEWMGSESLSVDTTVAWDTDDHTNIILEAGTYQVRYDPESKQITVGR
jgi:spore coat protein CotH